MWVWSVIGGGVVSNSGYGYLAGMPRLHVEKVMYSQLRLNYCTCTL